MEKKKPMHFKLLFCFFKYSVVYLARGPIEANFFATE